MPNLDQEAIALAMALGVESLRRWGGEQMVPHIGVLKNRLRSIDPRLAETCKREAYDLLEKAQDR